MSTTSRFPTEQQRQQDLLWTRTTPRPTQATWPYEIPSLAEVQRQWDDANKQLRDHEQAMTARGREREQADAARMAAARAEFDANEAARMAQREAILKGSYFAAGGDEAGWARDRDRVLSDDAMDAMRRQQQRGGALITMQQAW